MQHCYECAVGPVGIRACGSHVRCMCQTYTWGMRSYYRPPSGRSAAETPTDKGLLQAGGGKLGPYAT